MVNPLILVTGFGPYEDVEENPSGRLAERLDTEPPKGVELSVRILPVSFRGALAELDLALDALHPRRPDALLLLGVHKQGKGFRLERRATTTLKRGRPDVLGVDGAEVASHDGPDLLTEFELEPLAGILAKGGAKQVEISDDAGGFVCERVYYYALLRGRELGFPALLLHVPALRHVALGAQLRPLRLLVGALAGQLTT